MANRSRPTLPSRSAKKNADGKNSSRRRRTPAGVQGPPGFGAPRNPDEDPDIAGIRPGPQPIPWADDVPS